MMKVGLFFGSFNPVHNGHLIIAQSVLNICDIDKIWFVVSPHNPLKEKKSLLNHYDRLHLVRLATENNLQFKVSDIEFNLPQPSFTIDTLTYLREKYPDHQFSLLMGADNYVTLPKWKNYQSLLATVPIIVYKRADFKIDVGQYNNAIVDVLDVPLIEVSSTHIRQLIKNKKSARYLLPDKVYDYIIENRYYL